MAQITHLENAPIVEAVIDLRARMAAGFDLKVFANILEKLGPDYKGPESLTQFQFNFQATPVAPPEGGFVNLGATGFRYETSDGKRVAQFRKNGFSFSHLAPYTNWRNFFSEAERFYELYYKIGQPEEVTRVAVRYINRLLLPQSDVGDFTPYLTGPPPCPKGIAAVLTGFLTQIQVLDPATGVSGRITQTIQPLYAPAGQVPILLDIDVFEEKLRRADPDSALQQFETLRQLKNRYFFESITEKTVELYR
jgi:uncharacterized protein (TIGR04255 family)